jgi:hypothetical protein
MYACMYTYICRYGVRYVGIMFVYATHAYMRIDANNLQVGMMVRLCTYAHMHLMYIHTYGYESMSI